MSRKSSCVKSCLIINHDNVMPPAGFDGKQDSRHNAKLYDYFKLQKPLNKFLFF